MSFSVNNYYSGAWVDISDYVVGASEVPYVSRNRDWTMRVETWNVQIAGSLLDVRGGSFEFATGDKFTVKSGTTFLFLGVVEDSEFDYDGRVFNVTVKNALSYLDGFSCTHSTLHTQISTGMTNWWEYWIKDWEGNSIIGLVWLIKNMFELAGLTLDVTAGTTVMFNDPATGYGDIPLNEIFIDEDMFYNTGQSVAVSYATIETLAEYRGNIPTFTEYISEMCSTFGLYFIPTNADSSGNFFYTLGVEVDGTDIEYTIAENDKYSYQDNILDTNYTLNDTGAEYGYSLTRSDYREAIAQEIERYIAGGWQHKVNYYLNFRAFYPDVPIGDMTYKNLGTAVIYDPFYVQVTILGHGFNTGDKILIQGVVGMTDLNDFFVIDQIIDTNNFLVPLATLQTYTSGGICFTMGAPVYKYLTPSSSTPHSTDTWNTLHYKMMAEIGYIDNYYREENIECPAKITFEPVVENFIDLEKRTSNIIQESYT